MAHPTGFFFKANTSLRFRIASLAVAVVAIGTAFLLDDGCIQWMLAHHTPAWAHVAGALSRWGDWPELMALGLTLLLIAWARHSRGLVHLLLCMITASTLAGASANAVRLLSGRTRPNAVGVKPGWYGLWYERQFLLGKNSFHGFPSGHTAAAFAFFGTVGWARRGWAWLFLGPAAAIGWSRLYLNAHRLSDVTVALILGLLLAYVVWTRAGPALARLVAGQGGWPLARGR
ncbi:MAG TPA: phosphatase PAP2 family protein [Chthoniobacterales bacterium]